MRRTCDLASSEAILCITCGWRRRVNRRFHASHKEVAMTQVITSSHSVYDDRVGHR
jgi:hypothetical protein